MANLYRWCASGPIQYERGDRYRKFEAERQKQNEKESQEKEDRKRLKCSEKEKQRPERKAVGRG